MSLSRNEGNWVVALGKQRMVDSVVICLLECSGSAPSFGTFATKNFVTHFHGCSYNQNQWHRMIKNIFHPTVCRQMLREPTSASNGIFFFVNLVGILRSKDSNSTASHESIHYRHVRVSLTQEKKT